jgi:hypothetical protein
MSPTCSVAPGAGASVKPRLGHRPQVGARMLALDDGDDHRRVEREPQQGSGVEVVGVAVGDEDRVDRTELVTGDRLEVIGVARVGAPQERVDEHGRPVGAHQRRVVPEERQAGSRRDGRVRIEGFRGEGAEVAERRQQGRHVGMQVAPVGGQAVGGVEAREQVVRQGPVRVGQPHVELGPSRRRHDQLVGAELVGVGMTDPLGDGPTARCGPVGWGRFDRDEGVEGLAPDPGRQSVEHVGVVAGPAGVEQRDRLGERGPHRVLDP